MRRVAMQQMACETKLAAVALLIFAFLFGSVRMSLAQTPLPLGLDNNYMVTGDYVVGGWTKTGSATISGTLMSTGTIPIPDPGAYASNAPLQQVPAGADIVAAFLYWASVESSGVHSGQNGFFGHVNSNGSISSYPISGTILGNPNAPVSWSSGGCAGSSQGSKTIVAYRAEVSPYLPVDANGNIQPNATYEVSLPDTGKAGQPPFALGATLVIIYRVLAPNVPLNAVVIYDGAFAPSNGSQTMTQPMLGFYQVGNDQAAPVATKITHIVGNGQSNKIQQVFLNHYDSAGNLVHSTLLPSLYGTNPPFPGNYNGTWDNATWFPNSYATTPVADSAVVSGESSEATVVVPSSSNKGCVSWGAIIFSTTVQDTDHDGLIDAWKTNQGYCDAGANRGSSNQGSCPLGTNDPSWVALPGVDPPGQGNQDVFLQLDYMCTKVINNANGTTTCDPSGVSYKPDPQAMSNLAAAFKSNGHNVNVHIVPDDNNVILAQSCTDTVDANGKPVYCPNPGQAGVVDWKLGYSFLKTQPLNYPDETSCETRTPSGGAAGSGPLCLRRFQPGKNNSYHEVIFGVASWVPNWYFQDGSLSSITTANNAPSTTLTFTTSNPHGLAVSAVAPNGRVTISGAISNLGLNGTFLVQTVPTATTFTIQLATAAAAPAKSSDPFLSVGSGAVIAGSGVSDIGGADSLVSLGLWGVDGQTVPVESGTLMHELGHSFGLTHGGLYRTPVTGGYTFSFEPNCKPNFQSVMNYLFQVDLLDGALDYSEDDLATLNESTAATSIPSVLANASHPTTKWYALNQTFGSPATSHCDGTTLLLTDQPSFRLQGPASSITWSANQDINFDGKIETALQGYSDWANIDLRQIGATGNDFWAGGALPIKTGGGALPIKTGGGALPIKTGGGALPIKTGGGVGEITVQAANSIVRNPTNLAATLTPANTVQLSFSAPGFGQSLIASFNVYRSVNGAAFSKPAYATVSVAGAPLPLPNPLTFTDTKVSCATYSYFVTTVLSDGRESVPSNTGGPIAVPCNFIGFLSPLSTASKAPAAPTSSGSRNLGNAVPIKWELEDASGNPISDLSTLALMQACPATGATTAPASSTAPPCVLIYSPLAGGEGSTTYRYSAPNFIINWDTGSLSGLTAGYWTIELQLSDGRTYWTNLQF